jgi:hypothetical protein
MFNVLPWICLKISNRSVWCLSCWLCGLAGGWVWWTSSVHVWGEQFGSYIVVHKTRVNTKTSFDLVDIWAQICCMYCPGTLHLAGKVVNSPLLCLERMLVVGHYDGRDDQFINGTIPKSTKYWFCHHSQ